MTPVAQRGCHQGSAPTDTANHQNTGKSADSLTVANGQDQPGVYPIGLAETKWIGIRGGAELDQGENPGRRSLARDEIDDVATARVDGARLKGPAIYRLHVGEQDRLRELPAEGGAAARPRW